MRAVEAKLVARRAQDADAGAVCLAGHLPGLLARVEAEIERHLAARGGRAESEHNY
jgi:hypothetical protein